jgi:hypothetical protein
MFVECYLCKVFVWQTKACVEVCMCVEEKALSTYEGRGGEKIEREGERFEMIQIIMSIVDYFNIKTFVRKSYLKHGFFCRQICYFVDCKY